MKINALFIFIFVFNFHLNASVFSEVSDELNVKFNHQNNQSGEYQFTETTGSGLSWMDYNNDGLVDLLLINGSGSQHQLYKNEGNNFNDVTNIVMPEANNSKSRGMGVCSADVNQDGWIDFLITNIDSDTLYINQNGLNFIPTPLDKQITKKWSASCAFADLDNDGDVDLYVTRYVKHIFNGNKSCQNKGLKGYCNPKAYLGEPDSLYLNNGFGDFTEVTKERGIHSGKKDRGLGVVLSDFDQDQDVDIYVANDGSMNRLYINDGKGYFNDTGLLSGAGINHNGKPEAGMGIGLGDVNRDGLQDIVVTHFSMETNTLYLNEGNGFFSDKTSLYGIRRPSFIPMSWGVEIFDINNDGLEDILIANGHFHDFINELDSRQNYKQANHLYLNLNSKSFELKTQKNSFGKAISKSSRGLAIADWNNDGKVDFATNNLNDTVSIYENTDSNKNNWIGIKLIGDKINTSAIGAVVKISNGSMVQTKEIKSGGSFLSQSDLRLMFGLEKKHQPIKVEIKWPDGKKQNLTIQKINSWHTINYLKSP